MPSSKIPNAQAVHFRVNGAGGGGSGKITARPFVWRDPKTIAPRKHLYGGHYFRQFCSATIAPGGGGKTTLDMVESVAMMTGRPLLGRKPLRPLSVWYWNLEDPMEELERRFHAIFIWFGIKREDIEGRFFLNSGRNDKLVLAERGKFNETILTPAGDGIITECQHLGIDVLTADPFVDCHRVPENDNVAINQVAKEWGRIADQASIAVELAVHVRKTGGQEVTIDDIRGAGASKDAFRNVRALNFMSEPDARLAQIAVREKYFKISTAKNSFGPSSDADWCKFEQVELGNKTEEYPLGDKVGVVTQWKMPSAFAGADPDDIDKVKQKLADGEYAEDVRSNDWAGYAIAEVLSLNSTTQKDIIKERIRIWIKNGQLRTEIATNKWRKKIKIIRPAELVAALNRTAAALENQNDVLLE